MADEAEKTIDDTMTRVLGEIEAREKSETVTPAVKDASVEQQPATAAPEAVIAEQPVVGDRPRGPDGKFVAKTDAPITDRVEPTAPAVPATEPSGAPASWSAEEKALWPTLTPAAQAAITRREKAALDGFSQKSAELKRYEALEGVIGPRRMALSAQYGDEAKAVQTLFALSDYAAQDPIGFLRYYAQQRGVDLASLVGTPSAQQEQVSADPTVAALQQKLAGFEQYIQQQQTQQTQALQAEVTTTMSKFQADPKNKHFEAVRYKMGALIQNGLAKDIQDAYDQAVFADPTTRALVLQEQRAGEDAKAAEARAKQVADAKRIAETNVATTGALGASPTKQKSWEDTLDEKAKELSQRAA